MRKSANDYLTHTIQYNYLYLPDPWLIININETFAVCLTTNFSI